MKLPALLDEDELMRLPATWEGYVNLPDDLPCTIQYLNGELTISQASADHETLVIRIGALLLAYFDNLSVAHRVIGSSVEFVIPHQEGDLNTDVSVARKPIEYRLTPSGKQTMRVANALIVVEILPKSTRKFDQGEKMNYYKLIPSLQHMLFVDQAQPFASVYSRTNVPDEWLNHDYRTLDATVRLGALELPMSAIYRETTFDVKV